jgi:hypothetical protein
MALSPTAMA